MNATIEPAAILPVEPDTTVSTPQPLPAPAPARARHRNGKVARLPKQLRARVNEMLDDGLPFARIIQNLGPDAKDLTQAHIGTWKAGGYQDHLAEQRRLAQCLPRYEFLATFATQCAGPETYQAGPKIALGMLSEALVDLGPETLRRALAQDPRNAFRLLNALARILSGGLRCEQHLARLAHHLPDPQNGNPAHKKGISPQAIAEMQEKLNLM